MEVTLVVIRGKVNRGEIAFQPPAVLGRSREADLTIAHPMISRHHCELFEVDGLLMVRDLGSLNGTMLRDRRVIQAALCPDESFSVGPLTFQVRYQYDGDLDAVSPPTLAEPVVADRPAGSDSPGDAARPTETPRFLDAGAEPVAASAADAGPWSNAMPAEDDGPWASAAPADEAEEAEPAGDAAPAEPVGESPLLPPWSEPTEDESPAAALAELEPPEELTPTPGTETTEEASLKVRLEEAEPGESTPAKEPKAVQPEPEKKRRFSFWPFSGGKKSPKPTTKQGKPAPKSPVALPTTVEFPAAPPDSLPPTAGEEIDAPHDEAAADFLMTPDSQPPDSQPPDSQPPDSQPEEPEVAAEPAEPPESDKPSESSGEDDAFQDFLKGAQ